MEHESGATVSNLWTGMPSDDEAHDVRVDVPRNRDAEFTAFVRDSGAYLHRTAYLLCGDPHRAEELVQSTFERVYRTWAKVRPGTQRAYARRILVNLKIDSWRHGRRESFPGDDKIPVTPASDHAGRIVLRDELVRGLAQLSTTQRRVVVLRHLLDLPEAEVARELGLAVGTVKAANSRGLARLRDLLRAGAEAIEPVTFDERAVLDQSRAALRRRRAAQAVGAACVALLLTLGVLTRGPVPLPGVGPVVLPGGELIARLFDDGRTDGFGPAPAGNTPVDCPEEVPAPTPTHTAGPSEDVGPLIDPAVVDAADARPLTCYDVDIEAITSGSLNDAGLLVTEYGDPLPEPRGLSRTGTISYFSSAELYDDNDETADARIWTDNWAGGSGASSLTWYQGSRAFPTGLAVTGSRVVWSEYAAAGTSPRSSFLRTLSSHSDGGTTTMVDPLVTTQERMWLLATTRDHALWTAGVTYDDTRLFATTLDGDGTPTELAPGVTALAADDDEAVAAVLTPGAGGVSTTAILLFDYLTGADLTGTLLLEFDHNTSAEVTAIAVSDDVIAWTVMPVGAGSGTAALYVFDRVGDSDSVVQLADGVVEDLRASGGLVSWTSTDTGAENPANSSYLYRATPSASGFDGPDLARFPGGSVTASVAGARTAWLENADARQWLVKGAVIPTLERD
ncbi:SigE family RNA polymerase sigma factor [Promicromonospora panici]|uniref:SigE family RNA polymerase sigma factor n=1 Tax=Promicromonospora panici TaxID=2219658 RepID=UPI001F5E16C0|nr:SigE family RNA polymerase sigma factor [Promicromonospora panici]